MTRQTGDGSAAADGGAPSAAVSGPRLEELPATGREAPGRQTSTEPVTRVEITRVRIVPPAPTP